MPAPIDVVPCAFVEEINCCVGGRNNQGEIGGELEILGGDVNNNGVADGNRDSVSDGFGN